MISAAPRVFYDLNGLQCVSPEPWEETRRLETLAGTGTRSRVKDRGEPCLETGTVYFMENMDTRGGLRVMVEPRPSRERFQPPIMFLLAGP